MLLFNNQVKQNFKKTLLNANTIYEETLAALQPIVDTYWHYYYLSMSTYHPVEVTMSDLQKAFSTLPTFIKKLKAIQEDANKQYLNNSKLLLKFRSSLDDFCKWPYDICNRLDTLICGIPQLNCYRDYKELRYILENLILLRKQILKVNIISTSSNTDYSV